MTSSRRWFLGSSAASAAALALACSRSGSRSDPAADPVAGGGSSGSGVAGAGAADGAIRLDANESPYGPGPAARAALAATVAIANRYTDRDTELAALLAKRHGVTPEHVVLYPGSFGLLDLIALDALRAGGRAVLADPSFGWVIADLAAAIGAGVTKVPLTTTAVHDLDALTAAVGADTRLVYVCNPNNPTGTIVSASDLRAFCEKLAGRASVLVDEAYYDYVDDPAFGSMDTLVAAGTPIIVVRTFSKLFGLAGLRVGYAITTPAIATRLRTLRTGGDKAWLPAPAAVAAIASLGDAAHITDVRDRNARVRADFTRALAGMGAAPAVSHTNFVWFPAKRPTAVVDAMKTRGVRISGRDALGGVRVSLGLPAEMQTCATALAAVLPTV
jgi:histidinol-phosphate aminotransferase